MNQPVKMLPWFDPNDTQDYFCLTWNITKKCSFKCPYCAYCEKTNDLSPELTDSQFEIVASWISKNFQRDHQYTQITLFGGEPTTNRIQCTFAVMTACEIAQHVVLFTNLNAPLIFYQSLLRLKSNLQFTVTFHEHKYKAAKFIDDLLCLSEYRDRINVIVTDHDPSSEKVKEQLTQMGFIVNYLKIIHCGNLHLNRQQTLNEGTHLLTGDGWNKHVNDHTNHFTGWTCLAGKNNLYVECNGDVFPCQGQSASSHILSQHEKVAKPYFNILNQPDAIPLYKSTICPRKKCRLELYLSKYL